MGGDPLGVEDQDSVPVEVAPGAVVVLGSAWVGVPGQDLSVSERVRLRRGGLVMAACRREAG